MSKKDRGQEPELVAEVNAAVEPETDPKPEAEAVEVKAKFDIAILDGLSVDELEAVKARATELLKSKKELVKEATKASKAETEAKRVEQAIAKLAVGATITFTMKGQVRTAVVLKKSDKTATVKLDEGFRYIQFRFITDVVGGVEAPQAQAEGAEAGKAA
jgi:hypothetical protein